MISNRKESHHTTIVVGDGGTPMMEEEETHDNETTAMLIHPNHNENESTSTKSYNSCTDDVFAATCDDDCSDRDHEHEHSITTTTTTLTTSTRRFVSLLGPVVNLCSATLGAGVLALPYALYQAGLVWGCTLLVAAAASTLYSLQLLVEACRVLDTYTYEGIVQRALNSKRARNVTEISILLFCGGCAVAYTITIGDICQSLGWNRNISMVVVWTVAMVPLSLLRTMTSLQHASGIGIFSICFLILVANIHYWQDMLSPNDDGGRASHHRHPMSWSTSMLWPAHGGSMTSVLTACPLIIFAFSCQPNVCAIYYELQERHRMSTVLRVAVTVCALLYTSISIAAYLDFGTLVQPNVLQNYCVHYPLIQCAFIGMTIAVVMAFPLNIFPTRVTLEGLIWGDDHRHPSELEMEDTSTTSSVDAGSSGRGRGRSGFLHVLRSSHDNNTDNDVQEPLLAGHNTATTATAILDEALSSPIQMTTTTTSVVRHVGLTLAITSIVLVLAMVAPNISVVFGLLGGTTSSVIGFILPGLVGTKVLHRRQRWKAKCMVVGGIIVGIVTTCVTIYTTFVIPQDGSTSPSHYDPCNNDDQQ